MTTSKSMQATEPDHTTVIKLGGSLLERLTPSFFTGIREMIDKGQRVVIVHGGGPAINRALKDARVDTPIVNGLRVTPENAIGIVQSVLIGTVNPWIVHQLHSAGIQAIGLNGFDGGLIEASYLDKDLYGFVGKVEAVRPSLLELLIETVPVISCIGRTSDGQALNINADTAAEKIASVIKADELLFITDTAGIKVNGLPVSETTPSDIFSWIEDGTIYGGMIPKVQAAAGCLESGIPSVKIVNEALNGTTIRKEAVVR
ncbi:acetylglutamate kinase [Jeotgalibacillus sp. R-1-5s-1]|uniref:acetylglutamate kinase n=1 Tax=Jeotgalibacillus sp. R-1-5s-1 TaxID=2555897 RepID=UPI001069D3F9|nr:acetylglutamate kinase [Jeotgalibacillus sp. R-1-5s-1]TFD99876.1 acetylglutamate kinase [Jeotgalibacillus sp. R-1-5s-1]